MNLTDKVYLITGSTGIGGATARLAAAGGARVFVVSRAGISGRRFGDGPIHECTEEGWDTTLDTNARSMFLVCREVVRQMLAQPVGENGLRGTILNMASVLGFDKKYGVKIVASKEASWAGVRDKLVNGELDFAHSLYGLIYGVHLGISGPKKDMAVLMTLRTSRRSISLFLAR